MERITHLIPLSEFVNHVKQLEKPIDQPFEAFKLFQLGLIFRCTTFLEQSLELWQFVPVRDNGEVLEEPKHYKEWVAYTNDGWEPEYDAKVMETYHKAKERCLFEGWYQHKEEHITNGCDTIDLISFRFYKNDTEFGVNLEIVEDLAKYPLPLTQSALKQIY